MAKVEHGVRLPISGPLAGPEAIGRAARESERLGFDTLWVHDFVVWNKHLDYYHVSVASAEVVDEAVNRPDYLPNFYESLMSLAFVAGQTSKIQLGLSVLCLPFRNPILAAKQVATLDCLSHGRALLGIVVGAPKTVGNEDFEVLQVPRGDKYRRTREYFEVMRAIFTQERPSFQGRYVQFEPTDINPKPVQKPYPPVWMGGKADKSMEMVADFCDGWLPGGWTPEEFREGIDKLNELKASRGRADAQVKVGFEVPACIARTSEEAHKISDRTLRRYPESFAAYEGSMEAVMGSVLVGSPEEIRNRVGQYVDAGVEHFELKFIYNDLDQLVEQLSLWSEEVIPAFAGKAVATA